MAEIAALVMTEWGAMLLCLSGSCCSSAEQGDGLCSSDLGAAVRLSRFASIVVWLAKANKEEGAC